MFQGASEELCFARFIFLQIYVYLLENDIFFKCLYYLCVECVTSSTLSYGFIRLIIICFTMVFFIEFSHKQMSKPAHCHKKVGKHHSERKERTTYSPYKEKAEMVQKIYSEKATSPNKQKNKKNTCGYRGACISKVD